MNQSDRLRKSRPTKGFSLIEVLIAVTIIVLMGGVVAYNVFPELFRTQRDVAGMDIETLKTAVKIYLTRENKLPNESEWPTFLTEGSPKHPDPYIDVDRLVDGQIRDPWQNPYVYRKLSSRDFEIISYGADGAPGGEGDDADISSKRKQ